MTKRRHERHTFSRALKYVLNPGTTRKVFTGFAIDISESGLCIASSNIVNEGQEIEIKTKLPVPSQTGIVRWSKKIDDTLFKAGIMFV